MDSTANEQSTHPYGVRQPPLPEPRLDWRARYAFRGRRSTRRRAYTPLTLDGCSAERRYSADADDRVFGCRLVDATHRAHHLGERDPEPTGLLLGSDRHSAFAQDVEELLHRRPLVAEQ